MGRPLVRKSLSYNFLPKRWRSFVTTKSEISKTMKHLIRSAILVMVILANYGKAHAITREREIKLTTLNEKLVVLKLNYVEKSTNVILRNSDGELLFQDEVRQGYYGKVLNLQKLGKGRLELEIEDSETVQILPIKVTESTANIIFDQKKNYIKPVVRFHHGLMKVFLQEEHELMEMQVIDAYADIAYAEDIEHAHGGMRRYDMSKLPIGKYTIIFRSEGKSFYYTIINR